MNRTRKTLPNGEIEKFISHLQEVSKLTTTSSHHPRFCGYGALTAADAGNPHA
jgi:hypothetical protein